MWWIIQNLSIQSTSLRVSICAYLKRITSYHRTIKKAASSGLFHIQSFSTSPPRLLPNLLDRLELGDGFGHLGFGEGKVDFAGLVGEGFFGALFDGEALASSRSLARAAVSARMVTTCGCTSRM